MEKKAIILLALASMVATNGSSQKRKKVKKSVTTEVSAKVQTDSTETKSIKTGNVVSSQKDTTSTNALSAAVPQVPQEHIDTIYYNKNWKVIKNKAFATYYRLALYPAEANASKEFKTYYMSGELQSEGNFLELDKADDSKSKFTDIVSYYFKNGDVEEKRNYTNGLLNGECISYYSNGNVKEHYTMKNGVKDGLYASFNEEGKVCTLTPYSKGNPEGCYVVVDIDGNYSKYSLIDKKPILETPKLEEIETEYKNGIAWPYYNKNGLIVGTSSSLVDDIGDYRKIGVFIVNKSMFNIDIDPAQIEIYSVKNKKRKDYKLVSPEEYDEKIMKLKKKNAKRSIKHKVVVEQVQENNVNANLGAQVFNAGTSNTLKEFQKRICRLHKLEDNNRMKYSEKMPEDLGYLERTTIYPGEIVSGYLYTSDRKAADLFVKIKIKGIDYLFDIKESKKK